MATFRIVEHPQGVWRVEQRVLFWWRTVGFFGDPVQLYAPSAACLTPDNGRWRFTSEAAARSTLDAALANRAYRKIVDYP